MDRRSRSNKNGTESLTRNLAPPFVSFDSTLLPLSRSLARSSGAAASPVAPVAGDGVEPRRANLHFYFGPFPLLSASSCDREGERGADEPSAPLRARSSSASLGGDDGGAVAIPFAGCAFALP